MPQTFAIMVTGQDEVKHALTNMEAKLRTKFIRRAVAAAARIVVRAAKQNVVAAGLIQTGSMLRGISQRNVRRGVAANLVRVDVGVRVRSKQARARALSKGRKLGAREPFYWRFQELGTSRGVARTEFITKALTANAARATSAIYASLRRSIASGQ